MFVVWLVGEPFGGLAVIAVTLHLAISETPSSSETSILWSSALEAAWGASLKATGRSSVLAVAGDVSLAATLVTLSSIHASVNWTVT